MKKIGKISIIIIFAVLIAVFPLSTLAKGESDFSESENRALMTKPEISFDSIIDGSFQQEYDEYLSDQFIFRDFWVKAKTAAFRMINKKDINGVYFGKDDYLIEKYLSSDFDEELVYYNIDIVSEFLNRMSDNGIKSSCILVPSKGTVIENHLPNYAQGYDTSYVADEMSNSLNEKVKLLDLSDTLSEHNEEYIYYRTDHHWTTLGAYYGYIKIADEFDLMKHSSDYYNFSEVSDSFLGSTFDKVQLGGAADSIYSSDVCDKFIRSIDYDGDADNQKSFYQPSFLKQKSKYDYFLGGNYRQVTINTNANNDKVLLLIKDSYSNSLVPFLAENYSKIIMVDLRYSNDNILSVLDDNKDITDLMVIYNTEKLMNDENQYLLEEQ